jgi:hypothetical protein
VGAPDREIPAGADPRDGIMDRASPTRADSRNLARGAKSPVEVCVRNTLIEGLHAGIFPGSETGDYSDVKVVTPYGNTLDRTLANLGRRDETAHDRDREPSIHLSELSRRIGETSASAQKWAQPRLDAKLMRTVRRRKAAAALPKDISN